MCSYGYIRRMFVSIARTSRTVDLCCDVLCCDVLCCVEWAFRCICVADGGIFVVFSFLWLSTRYSDMTIIDTSGFDDTVIEFWKRSRNYLLVWCVCVWSGAYFWTQRILEVCKFANLFCLLHFPHTPSSLQLYNFRWACRELPFIHHVCSCVLEARKSLEWEKSAVSMSKSVRLCCLRDCRRRFKIRCATSE